MPALWKQLTATVPVPFLYALVVAAAFMGFVAWDQSHWWQAKEDYGFGWLVPAFVAFVVHDRWPKIEAALKACGAPGSPRASGTAATLLALLAYGVLAWAALVFMAGAFYRAAVGPSYPGTLALSLGTSALTLALLWLFAPEPASGAPGSTEHPAPAPASTQGWTGDARWSLVTPFVFPALVWLVSAPMLDAVEQGLSHFLLGRVTAVVFFVFDLLGLQIEQQGNVLLLREIVPGEANQVGVADACSGIRSLTACLFAGSFLAAVFLEKLWKKVALVACSMAFAFLMNLLRGLFLTTWAYNYGHLAIEGTVHDVAGYAVLGLTVVGLLCLLPLFNLTFVGPDALVVDDRAAARRR